MAKATSVFTFNQNGDFGTNLVAFGTHLAGIDGTLGMELSKRFAGLRDGTLSQTDAWTTLFHAVEVAKAAAQPVASAPAGAAPAPTAAPVAGHNSVTGWLLEGISIEGFRWDQQRRQAAGVEIPPRQGQ